MNCFNHGTFQLPVSVSFISHLSMVSSFRGAILLVQNENKRLSLHRIVLMHSFCWSYVQARDFFNTKMLMLFERMDPFLSMKYDGPDPNPIYNGVNSEWLAGTQALLHHFKPGIQLLQHCLWPWPAAVSLEDVTRKALETITAWPACREDSFPIFSSKAGLCLQILCPSLRAQTGYFKLL